ncbi:hypothetical protein L218DRAFT_118154 [Marasmius fiardii PR-910]|nr:hypothetical protein L218DRAFT_118154 [Marasmius fiardii PR-910]
MNHRSWSAPLQAFSLQVPVTALNKSAFGLARLRIPFFRSFTLPCLTSRSLSEVSGYSFLHSSEWEPAASTDSLIRSSCGLRISCERKMIP